MPKTVTPGTIELPSGDTFEANAVPDPFDARDLEYRPRLQVLPDEIDRRAGGPRFVYKQEGQSCTGHAVAAVINHVLGQTTARKRVSPYMLYRLARRYDQFPGEAEAGSSLRAAFKGWFNHGVALESKWARLDMSPEPDPDDEENLNEWRARPLGAFYRVNPFRLDDVQSAITELNAIAVSGIIHDGWVSPVRATRGARTEHIIRRSISPRSRGGHAYCLVGYNEIGFLVQNSWGTSWGDRGFAILPYEDWLDSVYDAWVARPGVPQTPFYSGRTRTAEATGGALATAAAPDLRRLSYHVVNTGNDGRLSETGKFVSNPAQVERVIDHMGAWHDFFLRHNRARRRNIVLWAHGGGVSEQSGLAIAQRQLNWWLNTGAYPISCVWETGPLETLSAAVGDLVRDALPFGGIGFDLIEQVDRLVEGQCRRMLRWAWREMKENARRASDPLPRGTRIAFPASSGELDRMSELPGASLLGDRLAAYVGKHGKANVSIHLVAHSAGSIYQASLAQRLAAAKIPIETMTWLGPAITIEEFRIRILPLLGPGKGIRRFTCIDLSDSLELNDMVGPVYHKSAVYLVAKGFEEGLSGSVNEVPILGLAKYWDAPLAGGDGRTLEALVAAAGGQLIEARSGAPVDARSDATTHASLDNDPLTLTSVAMRAHGATSEPERFSYQANAALFDPGDAPWGPSGPRARVTPAGGRADAAAGPAPSRRRPSPPLTAAATEGPEPEGPRMAAAPLDQPLAAPAGVAPPGDEPVLVQGEPARGRPSAPRTGERPIPEVAAAPLSGSPIIDVLQSVGWSIDNRPASPKAARKPASKRTAKPGRAAKTRGKG
jgi:hypothetical protein